MKLILTALIVCFSASICNAQIENTEWKEDEKIGIGTTTPEENLDVHGVLQIRRQSDDAFTNSGILSFQSVDVGNEFRNWYLQSMNDHTEQPIFTIYQEQYVPRFEIRPYVGWTFYDEEGDPEIYSDGVVGGGIYIPGSVSVGDLSVSSFTVHYLTSTISSSPTFQYNDNQLTFNNPYLNYRAKGGSTVTNAAHNFTVLTPLTQANSNIAAFSNGDSTLVRIDKDGHFISTKDISTTSKVKIGTGTIDIGTHSLAVNGSAIFTKAHVKLSGNWPDYVFEPEYKLPTLKYIEAYINKYKHLPDVPSASEVEQNGIDLGENQAILLKKIEELTLYIIEQEKRIEKLEAKLNKL
ncbi:MAG: hypothetical protein KF880_01470 [Ferruginibacter sp.]|nr:hypothetical protein [Ferruginibacter sp.]